MFTRDTSVKIWLAITLGFLLLFVTLCILSIVGRHGDFLAASGILLIECWLIATIGLLISWSAGQSDQDFFDALLSEPLRKAVHPYVYACCFVSAISVGLWSGYVAANALTVVLIFLSYRIMTAILVQTAELPYLLLVVLTVTTSSLVGAYLRLILL